MSQSETKIVIVAAYASQRAGLHALLAESDGCAVIGEIAGSADLTRLLLEARPDVVVYDDNPDDHAQIIAIVSELGIGLVMLGENRLGYHDQAAAQLPGWAYLLREADGTEIAQAAHAVRSGLIVLDRALSKTFLTPATQISVSQPIPGTALTAREKQVLQSMAQGLPNKQIAAQLQVSTHTIKFHVASILSKLDASSRTEAVTIGARRGDVLL